MSLGDQRAIVGAVCAAALLLAGAASLVRAQRVAGARASAEVRDAALPRPRGEGFVGSARCRACHPDAYASWHASWHRTMTQAVGPTSVIAAFDGRSLPHRDGEHAVERRGDEFWLRMPDANWLLERATAGPEAVAAEVPMRWQRAVMSTGAHNMQMYWVAAEPGRNLVAFAFSWSVEAGTWVANEATLLRPHEPYVVYGWNAACLKCHAVAGAPEVSGNSWVETEVAELGIACEACHGPGQAHVDAESQPVRRYAEHLGVIASGDIVNPGRLDPKRSSEICGQCHSASVFPDHQVWLGRGSGYRAGAELDASTRVVRHPLRADQPWIEAILDEDPDFLAGRFWGDGMIRISGRDYNGMIESPCNVDPEFGCLSCHEMHGDQPEDQLRELARGDDDRQCTQCHEQWREAAALEVHTRHSPSSSGSRCVNCHMPHTVYGLTKAIRSHQISIPNTEESQLHGRPNACNACHLDRSLAWAADALERDWGIAPPSLAARGESPRAASLGLFAEGGVAETCSTSSTAAFRLLPLDENPGAKRHEDFHHGLLESDTEPARAAAVEWLVRGDAGQRALAAWAFGWAAARETSGSDWMAPLLVRALDDDYAAVRWIALRSLRSLPGYEGLDWALAGALEGTRPDAATLAKLEARWPGTEHDRNDPAIYATPEGFDGEAWQRDRARRDERVVDLRE